MVCTACGEKPKNTAKGFTKAVVEINNPESLILLRKVVLPASMGTEEDVPAAIGKYRNVILQYEANGHLYLYSSDGIPTAIEVPKDILDRIAVLENGLADETAARENADNALQQEIDDIKNAPDVVDIVATYADLMEYDTSSLGDKDVIRVLEDETHDNESTYYRWNSPNTGWNFIGAVEGYYTKDQTDALLNEKQDLLTAGENISIEDESGALVISATDTTYTFDNTPTAGSINPVTSEGIKSYVDTSPAFKPFPASVDTTHTTQAFMSSILALNPAVGTAYLGTVSLTDMPAGLLQEEVEVYVYSDYVVYCIMHSTDVSPYEWWCSSYNYQGWRPTNTDTTYSASSGLNLNGTTFSVDTTIIPTKTEMNLALAEKQDLLTAGDNITIEDESGALVISAAADPQVQSDWSQNDSSAVDYIKNKPTIPTVNNATLTIQKNSSNVGTFTANSATDATINLTVPVTAADVSALPASTKYGASISLTINSSTYVVTAQLKDQDGNNLGSAQTIDLPLESVVVNGSYDSTNKKIILTLQNGNTIDIPVGDLVSGLQTEITAQNKLSADLVDDTSTTNKFVTATDKANWNAKQDKLTAGNNISIASDNTISATDTTYSNFTGTDGTSAGAAGLVPAPATTDAGKFLKADGTWDTAGGGSTYTAGDGIDITSNVISATNTGKGKVLTSANYNWNYTTQTTANPNCIATWLLEDGLYGIADPDATVVYANTTTRIYPRMMLLGTSNTNRKEALCFIRKNVSSTSPETWLVLYATSTSGTASGNTGGNLILDTESVVNNLTSTLTKAPLSANQGKVLKGLIDGISQSGSGAPTTSTTGTVGQLYQDTTNGKLYICTDTTGGTYTWEEVGAGGGSSVTELTSADYNYPVDNPDGVAYWLLDDGLYHASSSIKFYTTTTENNDSERFIFVETESTNKNCTDMKPHMIVYRRANKTSGVISSGYPRVVLTDNNIVQSTGTSAGDVMSQSAVTSMVFADPSSTYNVRIGADAVVSTRGVAIGRYAQTTGNETVAIGGCNNDTYNTIAQGVGATAIGGRARATASYSVAIGASSTASTSGEVSFGGANLGTNGYNSSNYRLLTGLYDPQSAHDAATKGYVDTALAAKQDELTAGDNITIEEESGALVISATGGSGADVFTTNEWNALWA